MKKLFTLLTLLLCVCGSALADSGTEKATNTGTKDTKITGTSYTIDGIYIAGSGGQMAGDMGNKGVKFRTGSDGARLVFTVNTGYSITGFRLYGISNYALKSGASEPCIAVKKVEVDGTETTYTGNGEFPAKGSTTSGSVILSGISASETIAIYFDNSNADGTQINGYYELDWETVASNVPLATVVSPTSATVYVGYTTTLTGSFTGGDFEGEWLSDNENVATVSQTGVVTGVAEGTANITYQWKDDQSQDAYKATAVITVATPDAVGTASSLALDIMQYETINLTDAYSFDSSSRTLVVSANQIRANNGTQKWMSYESAGGASKTWNATGVFKGSTFYNTGSSNNAVVLRSGRTYTLRVTNCEEISALVLSGGSSKTTITIQMDIYELDSYGIERVSDTPTATKSTTSTSEAVLTASGLDKTKVYEATFTSTHASSNSYVYEVAFIAPDTRISTALSFPQASYSMTLGETFTPPTLTKDPANLEGVVFSSSNTAVATVNETTGEVTIVAGGTTTITATFEETTEYKGATASYELTVVDPNATGYTNEAANVEWLFQDGTTLTPKTISPADAFLSTSVTYGSMTLGNYDSVTFKEDTENTAYTFNTITNKTGSSVSNIDIDFVVTPAPGITFKPTNVYFEAARIGHNNGKVTISAIYGDGTTKTLKEEHEVARNNTSGFSIYTTEDIAISDGVASEKAFTLRITLNKLDNDKADAFRNIKITGVVNGTPAAVNVYTITAVPNDASLGTVTGGAVYVEDDEVTLTATPKTGAVFVKWQKDGDDIEGGATITFTATADAVYTAIFQKLFAVSFVAGEGADKGTTPNVLNTVYVESTYTTPAANYYIAKSGFTATGWTDGTNNYGFGEAITVEDDIVLQPIFEANGASFTDVYTQDIVVNYNFDPTKGAPVLNIENATGYYVQQATINGTKIDMPIYINNVKSSAIDGKTGKTNNTSSNATTAQINEGSKFTITAIPGMTVTLNASNNISTTTVGGAEPTSGSGTKTATYTYTGEAGTADIVFGNDGKYYSSIVVTYPRTAVTKTISDAGYATFYSEYPLDFSGSGLTAYIATMDGTTVKFTSVTSVPANTGVLLKLNEGVEAGEKTITVAASTTDVTANVFEGVLEDTEVDGGIYVLMAGTADNKGTGFYKTTAEKFTVGANTAYLPANVVSTARTFIGFDEATAIEEVATATAESGKCYDLQGRRVVKAQKGLYIVDGKKVMVK